MHSRKEVDNTFDHSRIGFLQGVAYVKTSGLAYENQYLNSIQCRLQPTKKKKVSVYTILDLRIAHDRVGSSTDPNLNGHLKYPNNLGQSLNDVAPDKIRKYRVDYNNRPPSAVSFIPAIASTSAG
jgi:hypothetical protein